MTSLTLGADADNCGACGCSPCSDGKIVDEITNTFAGLIVSQVLIDTDCDGSQELTTVVDMTSINGAQPAALIYHDGAYATGYDTGALGEVSAYGGDAGDCISCFEQTFTGLGDLYVGAPGACPNDYLDEGAWLRNINLRLRYYFDPNSDPGKYRVRVVSIYPTAGGTAFEESFSVEFTFDTSGSWFCTSGTLTIGDADVAPSSLCLVGQVVFWSDTDTLDAIWTTPGGYDTNVVPVSGYTPGTASATWTFEATGTRVTTAA